MTFKDTFEPTVEGTETEDGWQKKWFKHELFYSDKIFNEVERDNARFDFIYTLLLATRADERAKLVEVVKGLERHSWDSGIYNKAISDVLAKISQV